jgi:hypothetical protein
MDKSIKILCICQRGNCRSVGTRYCLNERGYNNVIAIGWRNTSIETLKMLSDWAEIILVAKPYHGDYFSSGKKKVNKEFTIGEDKWGNPMHKDLHRIVNRQLDKIGLI